MKIITTPLTFSDRLSAERAQPASDEHTSACWDNGRCLTLRLVSEALEIEGLFALTGTIPPGKLVEACDESERREREYAACAAAFHERLTRSRSRVLVDMHH
jgi:hypothetical protein